VELFLILPLVVHLVEDLPRIWVKLWLERDPLHSFLLLIFPDTFQLSFLIPLLVLTQPVQSLARLESLVPLLEPPKLFLVGNRLIARLLRFRFLLLDLFKQSLFVKPLINILWSKFLLYHSLLLLVVRKWNSFRSEPRVRLFLSAL
jgi:hypothetical protein